MKSNIIILLEILIAILSLFYIFSYEIHYNFYFSDVIAEDLYASLISINYMNISNFYELNQTLYKIISNVLPLYEVYINNLLAFNNSYNLNKCYKYFHIINGSVYNILICSK